MHIAVVGLYNSGSSCLAGVLHHLGVDMGAPFFTIPGEGTNSFESRFLARELRKMWNEPFGYPSLPQIERKRILGEWMAHREANGQSHVGAKHPLLCLSVADVQEAWGDSTRFIWSHRPLQVSIDRFEKRHNMGGHACNLQNKLWCSVEPFFADVSDYKYVVDFDRLLGSKREQVDELIEFLELRPRPEQKKNALEWIDSEV